MSIQSYIYQDPQEASAGCAVKILELLEDSLKRAPLATIAISGGSTPKLLFGELAKAGFDWSRVHLFWVDERGVPPIDPQSNYKLAKEHLIDPAGFPAHNVHRIQAELDPKTAAQLYVEDIRKFFHVEPGAFPQFDIIHRGMGPDMHTASLFPGEPLINDHEHLAAATYVEKFHQWRITLLPGVLEAARNTIMLVAGGDKAEPLHTVLHEPYDAMKYPVQIGTHDGRNVLWFLDKPAARLLN
jgi:6-phosphogluconolactonase